jgi:cupin fold WbuC family metalloprotein
MQNIQVIGRRLLDEVSSQAQAAARRRKNYNFHAAEGESSHRLLNAIEPDSYIQPHRHLETTKDETLVVLRGRIGLVFFDADGEVIEKALLTPAGDAVGVNIPHGVFHTLLALEPGSVFFEAKAGPYAPLGPEEKAPWAPAEGDPRAGSCLAQWKRLFI